MFPEKVSHVRTETRGKNHQIMNTLDTEIFGGPHLCINYDINNGQTCHQSRWWLCIYSELGKKKCAILLLEFRLIAIPS